MASGFWSGKRVLVTGVSGFVGPYLARELLEQGAEVHGTLRPRADRSLSRGLLDRAVGRSVRLHEGALEEVAGLLRIADEVRPDVVFHLGAQSFVKMSFDSPLTFARDNCMGTANLLEAVRLRAPQATVVFAGSSEQYGLVFANADQYAAACKKYGGVFPAPERLPELPIRETNPMRPMSPYGASKVYGDYLVRNYACSFGVRGIVSRAFNHEGAGRGITFVTSQMAYQAVRFALGEADRIHLGDVNSFRDWSHVRDIVRGYLLLAERGQPGEVYNQGSMRTNSVLSYMLLALEEVGWPVRGLRTLRGTKSVDRPAEMRRLGLWGLEFDATRVDELMLTEGLSFALEDEGLLIATSRGDVRVVFDPERYRPSEVPILLSDASRGRSLGFESRAGLRDIVRDQVEYYRDAQHRTGYSLP
ncbi:MAG: GDP-mannose 4,6-dehydratase [bacterium]